MSEGPQTEFKASFEWSQHQKARSGDLRHASLKTIAAFLNSEGGTLWIGVDDAGRAVGLEDDLALIEDEQKLDTFENRLREFLKNHLDPMPLNSVKVTFPELDGVLVCSVEVDPRDGVTYLVRKDPQSGQVMEEIYVRDGMRTISLKGRSRDQFILGRRP
jgi:predicted HTH transcriptional regulator